MLNVFKTNDKRKPKVDLADVDSICVFVIILIMKCIKSPEGIALQPSKINDENK